MWANAQRDGRPAEYRWRPLFNYSVSKKCLADHGNRSAYPTVVFLSASE